MKVLTIECLFQLYTVNDPTEELINRIWNQDFDGGFKIGGRFFPTQLLQNSVFTYEEIKDKPDS